MPNLESAIMQPFVEQLLSELRARWSEWRAELTPEIVLRGVSDLVRLLRVYPSPAIDPEIWTIWLDEIDRVIVASGPEEERLDEIATLLVIDEPRELAATTDTVSTAKIEEIDVWQWLAQPGGLLRGLVTQVTHDVDLTDPSIEAQPVWLFNCGGDRPYAVIPPPGRLRDQLERFRLKPGDHVTIAVDEKGVARVAARLLARRTKAEVQTIVEEGVAAIMPDGQVYRGPERKAGTP